MKNHLLCILIALTFTRPAIASTLNIQGSYFCESREVGSNQVYTGQVSIKKTGETYTTNSKFNDGSSYQGTGIYDEKNQILATAAINTSKPDEIGVALHQFNNDHSITVKWTYLHRTDIAVGHCKIIIPL